jgi:dienelactone hydrolase
VASRGTPTGKDIKVDGTIDAYLATPPADKARDGQGILFLPDVIGIWQNSKLLADNFAAQGYTVLIPDIFNGDALKLNRSGPFDLLKWIAEGSTGDNPHTPAAVDPIVLKSIKALRDLGVTKIGAVGYCFGAKVSKRLCDLVEAIASLYICTHDPS